VEAPPPKIRVKGNHILRAGYFQDRLGSGYTEAFNKGDLEARLQDLHLNSDIQRFDAVLQPGTKAGDSQLDLTVQEVPRVSVGVQFDNYQSPAVGAERLVGTVGFNGVTGYGDRLQVSYGGSSGVSPLLGASYALPVNSQGTTFLLDYRKNDFAAVGGAFSVLQIASRSDTMGIGIREPVFKRTAHRRVDQDQCASESENRPASRQLTLGVDLEHERNFSSLLGMLFSFSPGAVDGKYSITALRATTEFTVWRAGEVFAVRSRLSIGLDWLGSTVHEGQAPDPSSLYPGQRIPDSRFISWLGQYQWTRRFRFLGLQQTESVVRADGQLANHDLLPLEQMPLGGRWSVRGFRENELVFDQALTTSAELRIPMAQGYRWASRLDLVPFFDQGFGADRGVPDSPVRSIGAFGIGTRWQTRFGHRFGWRPAFELYWGFLRYHRNPADRGDLQDHGIHFQVSFGGGS
jgi:hemolysin activation/secretion protein